MARATISLPVPLSPWISTVLRRLAISSARLRIWRMRAFLLMTSWVEYCRDSFLRRMAFSRCRFFTLMMRLTSREISSGLQGLTMYSCAPSFMAVMAVSTVATVDTAITAMKEGAQEYIVKPCNPEEISLLVSRIIKVKNLQRENAILRKKLSRHYSTHDVISKNARMRQILELAGEVASLRSTVLIQGESGTGKEMIARAIHYSGDRAYKPFVAVSCAALAETLLESELFGHEKGSFTGATAQKRGTFEMADSGTIFLDEIGDISAKLQCDLLRVLQERCFYRVGGSEEVRVDVRVIAATHVHLQQAVTDGKFREDLFYRLNVIQIDIPPLRDRREDIPLLASHFLERLSHELGKEIGGITEG